MVGLLDRFQQCWRICSPHSGWQRSQQAWLAVSGKPCILIPATGSSASLRMSESAPGGRMG